MKIVIIGTGNMAQVLGKILLKAGHTILQVYGRNKMVLNECAALLDAAPVMDLSLVNSEAELCIIATSDTAIAEISGQLHLPQTIIVHTSGGVSINALNTHQRFGALYPLQSLRKELPYLPAIPFFADGNTEEVKNTVADFAKTISGKVYFANDEQRLKLHIAAVFCSNFTNHLFALTNEFCNNEQLSFDHLMPLIKETVNRMQFDAPENLQTGPAIRRDEITIRKHLEVLQDYPLLANVYEALTKSIQSSVINR